MASTKITKTFKSDKAIEQGLHYIEWFGNNPAFVAPLIPSYEYDFDGEQNLIDICLSGDCLHAEDIIESSSSLQYER